MMHALENGWVKPTLDHVTQAVTGFGGTLGEVHEPHGAEETTEDRVVCATFPTIREAGAFLLMVDDKPFPRGLTWFAWDVELAAPINEIDSPVTFRVYLAD